MIIRKKKLSVTLGINAGIMNHADPKFNCIVLATTSLAVSEHKLNALKVPEGYKSRR